MDWILNILYFRENAEEYLHYLIPKGQILLLLQKIMMMMSPALLMVSWVVEDAGLGGGVV